MSLVDENMEKAHGRATANKTMFHFRKNILSSSGGSLFVWRCGHIHSASLVGRKCDAQRHRCFLLWVCQDLTTLDAIFNGKPMSIRTLRTVHRTSNVLPFSDVINTSHSTKMETLGKNPCEKIINYEHYLHVNPNKTLTKLSLELNCFKNQILQLYRTAERCQYG